MKGFRGTYVMAALVAVLAAYTAYEYKHASEELDEVKGEQLAFTLKRDDVTRFELDYKGEVTVLTREGEDWHVTKPVEDLAEASAVGGFLYGLMTEKLKTFRAEEDGKTINWAEIGLDPVVSRVEVSVGDKKEEIAVSSKNAFDGSYFVRQKDQVFLGGRGLAQLINRTGNSFRSLHLWREKDVNVQSVSVENGKDHFQMHKEKETWTLEPKPAFVLDSAKIDTWVSGLQSMVATEVVKEGISDQDKIDYLLLKPSLVVTFSYKDKAGADKKWTLTVGQDKGNDVFLYTDQRPTIYKTLKSVMEKNRVLPAYFRDGHSPFALPVEEARLVRVKTDKVNVTLKKNDTGWEVLKADGAKEELELDQPKLAQLFQNVHSLDAAEFVAKGSGFKDVPQFEVSGDKGQLLFSLSWGDEYKSKNSWNSGVPLRYVKTNMGKEIMGIRGAQLDKLVEAALVHKKPTTATGLNPALKVGHPAPNKSEKK